MNGKQRKWFRFIVLAALIVAIIFFYSLRSVLWPFIFAFFIAYILNPWVNFFQRRRLSRNLSVFIVFTIVTLIIVLSIWILVPQMIRETADVRAKLPQYIQVIRLKLLPWVQNYLQQHPDINAYMQDYYEKALKPKLPVLFAPVLHFLGTMFSGFVNFIVEMLNVLLVPVLAFYMLSDFPLIKQHFMNMIPPRHQERVRAKIGEVDSAMGQYLRGQLTVSLCLAVIYIIGLLILRVPLAVPIGLFSGLANLVPYLGFILGISLSFLFSFVDNQQWQRLVFIVIVYAFAQLMEGTIIGPKVVGKRTGLHPVVIMMALVIGGTLFGFMGMVLAVPFVAVASVFVKSAYDWYLTSDWYSHGKTVKPTIAE
jgi:sporulation integral membrane protein YtvI